MLKKLKNQDGFTLLEVIISIAVLSILSVFILQMFISSATANQRAQNIDVAAGKAIAVVEQFKMLEDIADVETAFAAYDIVIDGEIYSFSQFFDNEWVPAAAESDFRLDVAIRPCGGEAADAVGVMYNIKVSFVDKSLRLNLFAAEKAGAESVLVAYSVDQYFKNKQ